jgi:hypothetical protein
VVLWLLPAHEGLDDAHVAPAAGARVLGWFWLLGLGVESFNVIDGDEGYCVTRNKNFTPVMMRLRLQMLMPLSAKCSWKWRISSAVAVSGDRLRNAANRLQLSMWLLCECAPSLRAFMSSIIRWRSGLTVFVLMGNSCLG